MEFVSREVDLWSVLVLCTILVPGVLAQNTDPTTRPTTRPTTGPPSGAPAYCPFGQKEEVDLPERT